MLDRQRFALWADGRLPPNEVHVWVARIDEMACRGRALQEILSEEESKRAGRFHFEQDRVRYVTGLAVLRSILGSYLRTDAKRIEFGREKKSKPVLAGTFARGGIQFNMSRSKGLALYAFARNRPLGVDVEKIEPVPEMDRIVSLFFAPREIQDYTGLPLAARPEAFYRCWARKEAFMKAMGEGLFRPLSSFSVPLLPDEQSTVKNASGNQTIAPCVLLRDLPVERGYAAAIAVEGIERLSSLREQTMHVDGILSRMRFSASPE